MHKAIVFLLSFSLLALFSLPVSSADGKKKKRHKSKTVIIDGERIEIPEVHIDMEEMRHNMKELRLELGKMKDLRIDVPMPDMDDLRINLEQLRDLEDLHFEIPDIDIDIPEIAIAPLPPIPPIHVEIPEISWDGFRFEGFGNDGASRLFDDLSEDEELRLQALRSVARQPADVAIPALEKSLRNDKSPAVRYRAVSYLRKFLDEDDRIVPLLSEVIRRDENIKVRKKAIRILGESKDPRTVEILMEIVKGK